MTMFTLQTRIALVATPDEAAPAGAPADLDRVEAEVTVQVSAQCAASLDDLEAEVLANCYQAMRQVLKQRFSELAKRGRWSMRPTPA